jgi:hypothetical protein
MRGILLGRNVSTPLVFLVAYAAVNFMAIAITSLETRHLGQFLPALLILGAAPDTREPESRRRVTLMRYGWVSVVLLVHLAWLVMKFK